MHEALEKIEASAPSGWARERLVGWEDASDRKLGAGCGVFIFVPAQPKI